MKKFALTGIFIEHSKSPLLFAAAYSAKLNYLYELMPTQSAEEAMQLFLSRGLCGMNVTAPFKTDILQYVDWRSEEVEAIGATNVILLRDKKICAYNTDTVGVVNSFTEYGIDLKKEKAIVLGAGGAAQAAVYALKQAGAEVWLANRTESKAKEVADRFDISHLPSYLLDKQMQQCRLVINTLPEEADIYREFRLYPHNVVLDANYTDQPLYGKAIANKVHYISGLFWLLYQAVPSFFLFTGKMPNVQAMIREMGNNGMIE